MKINQILIELKIKNVSIKKAIDTLNANAKNALWMLENDAPIYRGDEDLHEMLDSTNSEFAILDPTKSRRTPSAFWPNAFLETHPDFIAKGLPSRFSCLIGSPDIYNAAEYSGGHNAVVVLIPLDGVKIGTMNSDDFWNYNVTTPVVNQKLGMEDFNFFIEEIFAKSRVNLTNENPVSAIAKLGKLAQSPQTLGNWLKNSHFVFNRSSALNDKNIKKFSQNFIPMMHRAFDPIVSALGVGTTASLKGKMSGEVWFSGPCVAMTLDMWNNIRDAWLESK